MKNRILYGLAVFIIFGIVTAIIFSKLPKGDASTDIVIIGDSIIGEYRDESSVSAMLQEISGRSVINGCFGGTCASRQQSDNEVVSTLNVYSLDALSLSIVSGDFAAQKAVNVRESATDYFDDTVNVLASLDFSKVDTLIIQYGINDYHSGVPIENPEEPFDNNTFAGALRMSITRIRKAYPDVRIMLMTPTYSWYVDDKGSELRCDSYDTGSGTLDMYVDREIQIAEEMGIEIIDVFHGVYDVNREDACVLYTRDGVHPNEQAREILAKAINDAL